MSLRRPSGHRLLFSEVAPSNSRYIYTCPARRPYDIVKCQPEFFASSDSTTSCRDGRKSHIANANPYMVGMARAILRGASRVRLTPPCCRDRFCALLTPSLVIHHSVCIIFRGRGLAIPRFRGDIITEFATAVTNAQVSNIGRPLNLRRLPFELRREQITRGGIFCIGVSR